MRLTSDEAVAVILLAVLACCVLSERRRHRRELAAQALDRAKRTFPQPPVTQAETGADMEAVIRAIRDEPRQRLHAWLLRCGCFVAEDATGTQVFPCAACEAIAEVENRTEQT